MLGPLGTPFETCLFGPAALSEPATTRGAIRWKYAIAIGALALAALIGSTQVCLSTGFTHGLWLNQCPDGELRQLISVNAGGLTRGATSSVTVSVQALYSVVNSENRHSATVTKFAPELALVANGAETPLPPQKGWQGGGGYLSAAIALPKVNDGQYTLRTRVTSTLGSTTLDLPLPLFTPARVHVITDRPLYEPGNTVKFRALVLKANDLTPLEERPGTWLITDPQGEVLLEEKAPTGPWGVVAGSFPIDRGAVSGEWTVSWRSGTAVEQRRFTVKPFTLPRFKVEAARRCAGTRRPARARARPPPPAPRRAGSRGRSTAYEGQWGSRPTSSIIVEGLGAATTRSTSAVVCNSIRRGRPRVEF